MPRRRTTMPGPGDHPSDLQPVLAGREPAPMPATGKVAPSSAAELTLRLVLIACFIAALAHALTLPAERSMGGLLTELSEGNVEAMAIERPPANTQGQMRLRVDWTQTSGRDGYAHYEVSTLPDQPGIDEGETALTAARTSPAPVEITVIEGWAERPGIAWNTIGLVGLGALLVLIIGPQPRIATKWAWFWLAWAAPVVFLAFLVLEPVPAWRRTAADPRARRLTGGWAFLLGLLFGTLWHGTGLAM